MYPLIMRPYFRHGSETPWGGARLREVFGKEIPDDKTGESLEISALPGRESVIVNGALAGEPLSGAIERWGSALTGPGAEEGFPLLLKLIDARETLSVQVHPGDDYARAKEGKRGKTEAWVVLDCPRGARLALGLNGPLNDDVERQIVWKEISPGDVYYIPHGLVHAIGAGALLYEIQQTSDVTYRIWDWGRGRALHTEDARNVARPELASERLPGATEIVRGGSRTYYICDGNFELTRLNVFGSMPLEPGRVKLLTALGDVKIAWPDGEAKLAPGESCLVPAALEGARLEGVAAVMLATTPDRAALSRALGNRAELVAGGA